MQRVNKKNRKDGLLKQDKVGIGSVKNPGIRPSF